MRRGREAILMHGGAARSNVFTRTLLALYGDLPWRATPCMPVELMIAPKWFPVRIDMMSYWARTVLVPLLIIADKNPVQKIEGPYIFQNFSSPLPTRYANGRGANIRRHGLQEHLKHWTALCRKHRHIFHQLPTKAA